MPPSALKTERAADAVARYLEQLILEGTLRPDQPLLPERELAHRLNVSRPTLRDGLKLLESKGLLVPGEGRGLRVAQLGRVALGDPLMSLLAERAEADDDYLEFRDIVESAAAALAAERATAPDRDRIAACLGRIEAAHAAADPKAEAEADAALHLAIYEASHNLVLLQIMRALADNLRRDVVQNRDRMFAIPAIRNVLRDQHRAISEAILAGDAETARRATHAHLGYIRRSAQDLRAAETMRQIAERRASGGGLAALGR